MTNISRNLILMAAMLLCTGMVACVDNSRGGDDQSADSGTSARSAEDYAQAESPALEDESAAAAGDSEDAMMEEGANPCDMSGIGETRRVRGVITATGTSFLFTACGTEYEVGINDDQKGSLGSVAPDLVGPDGKYYAIMDVEMGEAMMNLAQLWRAEAPAESNGCDEDMSHIVYRASGNEPFWDVTVFDNGQVIFATPEGEQYFTVSENSDDGHFVNVSGTSNDGGPEITMEFARAQCFDTMSGAYAGMNASLILGDLQYGGCAWVGEAKGITEDE